MKSDQLFYRPQSSKPPEPLTPPVETPPVPNWKDKYQQESLVKPYKLEHSSDDSELNRAITLKSYDNMDIIEGKPGKIYFDKENGVVKVYVSTTVGWKTLAYEP